MTVKIRGASLLTAIRIPVNHRISRDLLDPQNQLCLQLQRPFNFFFIFRFAEPRLAVRASEVTNFFRGIYQIWVQWNPFDSAIQRILAGYQQIYISRDNFPPYFQYPLISRLPFISIDFISNKIPKIGLPLEKFGTGETLGLTKAG